MKNFSHLILGLLSAVVLCASATVDAAERININTAGSQQLQELNGIGPAYAENIISYRSERGPFEVTEDIKNVNGIGPATYSDIKDRITVGTAENEDQNTEDEHDGTGGEKDEDDSDTSGDTSSDTAAPQNQSDDSGGVSNQTKTYVKERELTVEASADKTTAAVNTPVQFTGRALYGPRSSRSATRQWNFGTGETRIGSEVVYTYEHPGRYRVVFTVSMLEQTKHETIEITIVEPDIVISDVIAGGGGYVEIANHDERSYELSGWMIRTAGGTFSIPDQTYIRADARLRFDVDTMGVVPVRAGTRLLYPNGEQADQFSVDTAPRPVAPQPAQPRPADEPAADRTDAPVQRVSRATRTPQIAAAVGAADGGFPVIGWVALGLAVLGGGAIVLLVALRPRRSDTHEADRFSFVD